MRARFGWFGVRLVAGSAVEPSPPSFLAALCNRRCSGRRIIVSREGS
jgi:hypothetical protein